MAGWIKMPLGMEVGLGDFVVDGNPAPPPQLLKKGAEPPIFGPSIVAKRLDQDGTWQVGMEVGLGSGHIVLDVDPAPPAKGAQQSPSPFVVHVYCGHGRPS